MKQRRIVPTLGLLCLFTVAAASGRASAQFVTHARTPQPGAVVVPAMPSPRAVPSVAPVPAQRAPEPDPALTEEEETFPRQPDVHDGPVTVDGDADPRGAAWPQAVPALGICIDRARSQVTGLEVSMVVRVTVLPGGQVESATVVGEPAVLRRVGYRVMSSSHVAESVVDGLASCATQAVRAVPVRVAHRAIFTVPVTLATRPMNDREHAAAAAERDRRDAIQRRQDRADTARDNAEAARANAEAARAAADEARANAETSRQNRRDADEEVPTVCTNTCRWADDGECDDGGPDSMYSVCRYGTDCGDCGARPVRSRHRRRR